MRVVDVIAKKRDGGTLSRDEIELFVNGVTRGTLPDYQASALLMAIVLRGMTIEETSWLTDSIVNSGARVDLSDIPGVKVGKHSTGGVGDKVSIVLAPLVAACGVVVPKMSGRGLGHTGGTLDKLESIPGYRVDLDVDEFKAVLKEVGTSIIGQTESLVPADKKLYALRDVTATIGSIPLISASVMSKKLAEGSDVVMLDVKCGDGAFMKDEGSARALASSMVAIGTRAGVRTEALITDMDTPLGHAVGNALELVECFEALQGNGPGDLSEVVKRFATRALVLAGRDSDEASALRTIERAWSSGKAIETLGRMIERQGGNRRVIDDHSLLPYAGGRQQLVAPRDGFVAAVKAGAIGLATSVLGAGRSNVGDRVDPAVGVVLHAKPGSRIARGQLLADIHHRDGRGITEAMSICSAAFTITDEPPTVRPVILGDVR
jgi:pyrimidine-nucleoside phosphorylase